MAASPRDFCQAEIISRERGPKTPSLPRVSNPSDVRATCRRRRSATSSRKALSTAWGSGFNAAVAQRESDRQVFLDRDVALQPGVACAIGDAETALPEHRDDLVLLHATTGGQGSPHLLLVRGRDCGLGRLHFAPRRTREIWRRATPVPALPFTAESRAICGQTLGIRAHRGVKSGRNQRRSDSEDGRIPYPWPARRSASGSRDGLSPGTGGGRRPATRE